MSLITLNSDQQQALDAVLAWLEHAPEMYLTLGGYAGTGKTTLLSYLRHKLHDQKKPKIKKVAFCCYTGKAASVLRQKLKEAEALYPDDSCGTIHSLIYKAITDDQGVIVRWDKLPSLAYDLIIIDEGSMINQEIWSDLLNFRVPILVAGDHGQLPPIEGTFNLMKEPMVRLEKIVRQAAGNPIIRLSEEVRKGGVIPYGATEKAVYKFRLSDDRTWEVFEKLIQGSQQDYICICGTNRTRVGLNQKIRLLKGFEDEAPQKNDRLICLKNNHTKALFNGMIGVLKSIKEQNEHWYKVKIAMEDGLGDYHGSILKYQFNAAKTLRKEMEGQHQDMPEKEWGDLFDFGYALTAHKAQGSEAERVILFEERFYNYDEEMWQRWLYTAITRARTELFIFS